ncbi:MAG TPA: homoserine dehydrogenase [Candidatus Saccharimonadales bacterium]|nr:homoserine dehydrogenase [Candidatus Saccharimonadales bacterium]
MATITAFDQASPTKAPTLKVAILGFGTVGSAVARILCDQPAHSPLKLTHIFNRNVERKRVDWVNGEVNWLTDVEQVLGSDADIIVELVGGTNPAHDWISRALMAGKSVVTANKKLIAQHGPQLSALAREHGGALSFGASVAGGVPVIDALQEGLAGDQLYKVCGILNGTCNYILTKVEREGVSFEAALAEAQSAGFAEADPTDDVDGYDARAKLVILSRIGLKAVVEPEQIPCSSIRSLSAVDFTYSHELGCTIRQISRAERRDGHIYASVQPALVPIESPMAHITGSLNLVLSSGKYGGQTAFSGHGAGGHSTAVAVVSDLLDIARGRSGDNVRQQAAADALPVSGNFASAHYLRFTVRDRPGIVAAIANALAAHNINIDALLQRPGFDKDALPFVVTLEHCGAEELEAAMRDIRKLDFLVHAPLTMPILTREL